MPIQGVETDNKRTLEHFGIIDARRDQYSLQERLHLIRCLKRWGANLYIYGQLTWSGAITHISEKNITDFIKISEQCKKYGINLWAWMKPGDARYIMNSSDRSVFIENIKRYLHSGASGFYLLMDDIHRGQRIAVEDAPHQANLIEEIFDEIGDSFKAICAEHYFGNILKEHPDYWDPIIKVLPKDVMITWTGPRIWNKTLEKKDFMQIEWPLMLFDNYFASDSDAPERSPIYPYNGRAPDLTTCVKAVVINPNNHYPWQYCALKTAMEFWNAPSSYNPEEAFRGSIRDLGDMYMEDHLVSS